MGRKRVSYTFATKPRHMARIIINPQEQLDSVAAQRNHLERVLALPIEDLLRKPSPKRWSAAEVVEHMVEAHKLYVPKLDAALSKAHVSPPWNALKASRMTSFLCKGFEPKAGKVRYKMKTQKVFEPKRLPLAMDQATFQEVLVDFKASLDHLEKCIKKTATLEVTAHRFASAIGPVVSFNAAEAVEFILRHNARHFFQIDQVLG